MAAAATPAARAVAATVEAETVEAARSGRRAVGGR